MARVAYRAEIDGLRAVAVAAVVAFHAHVPGLEGGFLGVDVFFVISGYLITALLIAERAETGRISLAGFWARRARRILPALLVVAVATVPPAVLLMTPDELAAHGRALAALAVFGSNVLFWAESGYFAPDGAYVPLLHTWSLAVEEQFYLLYPLLVLAALRGGTRRLAAVLAVVAAGSLAFAEAAWPDAAPAAFYLLPGRAWQLAAGALVAVALSRRPGLRGHPAGETAAVAGLAAILWSVLAVTPYDTVPGHDALPAVLGTAAVILFAGPRGPVARLLSLRPLVGLGLVSYSAYLWHQPLFAFARLEALGPAAPATIAAMTAATLALAVLTWMAVEQPARWRLAFRPLAAAFVVTAAGCVAAGLWLDAVRGLPGRISPEVAAAETALADLRRERIRATAVRRCHFNRPRPGLSLEEFLARWDCTGPGPGPAALAVAGDSHGADIAGGLRLAGHPVMQITGAGCSLVPALTDARCAALLGHLRARMVEAGHRPHLLLVNRWDPNEMTAGALSEIAAYWEGVAGRLTLLTSRPVFPGFDRKVVGGAPRRGVFATPCIAADAAFSALSERRAVAERAAAAGIGVLSSADLVAGLGDGCGPYEADGTPLLVDEGHLSAEGARRVGARLAARLGLGEGAGRAVAPGP